MKRGKHLTTSHNHRQPTTSPLPDMFLKYLCLDLNVPRLNLALSELRINKVEPHFNVYNKSVGYPKIIKRIVCEAGGHFELIFSYIYHKLNQISFNPKPTSTKRDARLILDLYAPLCEYLALYNTKHFIETQLFPIAYPKEYHATITNYRIILEKTSQTEHVFRRLLMNEIVDLGIKSIKICSRVKSVYSLWQKSKRKKPTHKDLNDLIGTRVITPNYNDCYKTLYALAGRKELVNNLTRDYIQHPKSDGYQSIHIYFKIKDILCECQLRTQRLHQRMDPYHFIHYQWNALGSIPTKNEEGFWIKAQKNLLAMVNTATDHRGCR